MISGIRIAVLSLLLIGAGAARAETLEQWVELLTRVHGGFGSFLLVGIRIGEDAMNRLSATIQDPLGRYKAVMALPDLFTLEPVK